MKGRASHGHHSLKLIREGLLEEMERDPNVFLLGEDIGIYGGAFKVTAGMLDRFGPRRVVDTPISESAIVGAAIGASFMGLRPVAEMQFADFISCGFDQIVNFAAKSRYRWNAPAPLVVPCPLLAAASTAAPTIRSRTKPGLPIRPASRWCYPLQPAMPRASSSRPSATFYPVIFFEHKALYRRVKEDLPEGDYTVPIGKANVHREGRHISVITYSAMVHVADEAAGILERDGISVEAIDLRTLTPLTRNRKFASVRKTSKALVFHEATLTGGFGGKTAARITEKAFEIWDGCDAPGCA